MSDSTYLTSLQFDNAIFRRGAIDAETAANNPQIARDDNSVFSLRCLTPDEAPERQRAKSLRRLLVAQFGRFASSVQSFTAVRTVLATSARKYIDDFLDQAPSI